MEIRGMRPLRNWRLGLAAAAVCVLATAQSASADFNFAPTGNVAVGGVNPGVLNVQAFNFAAGNAIAVGAVPLAIGKTFTFDFQTHLTGFTGVNAPSVVPGLNSTYYITEVGTLSETVTGITVNADGSQTATFALNAGAANNRISIFFNTGPWSNTNDATGNGFVTATSVEIARLNPTSFINSSFINQSPPKALVPFNPSNATDTRLAIQGNGATGINNSVTTYLPNFFQPPTGTPTLVSSIFNSNLSSFFDAVPPSALFRNLITSATFAPVTGPVNGQAPGPDFQLQVSGYTESFTVVPEPASVTLMGLGLVGVVAFARRNRTQAA